MRDDLTHPGTGPGTGLRGLAVQATTLPHNDSSGAHHVHG